MVTRRRSTRALNNDAAIRAAAVELVLRDGIDAISFRDVGRIAGLTHGALYARFEDVEELLVDLWCEVLSLRATALFHAALTAATQPSEETVHAVFEFVRGASPDDAAMVQVLLSSRRFVILHEEVETFIRDDLETNSTEVMAETQSRALLLFGLVMVKILEQTLFGLNDGEVDYLESLVLASFKVDPNTIAAAELREPTERIISLPDSELRSKLAYYTFSAVGTSGYSRATISRISRRADCSPGAIYKLYPSKEDLVIAATRRIMQAPWITITTLADVLEDGVLTHLLFSAASAQNEVRRNFTLEIALASAHSEKIRAAIEAQMQGLELLVPLLEGITGDEKNELRCMIRAIISMSLGTSFFSTVTKVTDMIHFEQFAEPVRRSLLARSGLPWAEIRRQLQQLSTSISLPVQRSR